MITKTLLHNASIIIEDPKYFTLDRFFDLSALCEATVLFDELTAIESSNVLPSFSLSKHLKNNKIVSEFRPSFSPSECNRIIEQFPEFILHFSAPTFWEKGIEPAIKNLADDEYEEPDHPYLIDDVRPMETVTDSGFIDTQYYYKEGTNIPHSNIFVTDDDLRRKQLVELMDWLDTLHEYPSLPDDVRASNRYIIRSIGYLLVAVTCKIDYFPDFLRIPYIVAHTERIYKSFSRELYRKISEILETDINEIVSATKSLTFPIPPFTSMLLEKADALDDIPSVLSSLRSEFQSFRNKLSRIDDALKNASTINEKKNILRQKTRLYEEIARNYEDQEKISYKEVLNYADKWIRPITGPMNPFSYSSGIIAQPVEWIRRWWIRRPVLPLFRIDGKVRNIEHYDTLIEKLWGSKIQAYVLNEYRKHAAAISEIFKDY